MKQLAGTTKTNSFTTDQVGGSRMVSCSLVYLIEIMLNALRR